MNFLVRRSRVYGEFWPVLAAVWGQGYRVKSQSLGWFFACTLIPTGTKTSEQPTNLKIPSPRLLKVLCSNRNIFVSKYLVPGDKKKLLVPPQSRYVEHNSQILSSSSPKQDCSLRGVLVIHSCSWCRTYLPGISARSCQHPWSCCGLVSRNQCHQMNITKVPDVKQYIPGILLPGKLWVINVEDHAAHCRMEIEIIIFYARQVCLYMHRMFQPDLNPLLILGERQHTTHPLKQIRYLVHMMFH